MGPAPLLVLSPHLDDAVLSCGELLHTTPGSVVATLFAGGRTSWTPATAWDRTCGFGDGVDAIVGRRHEDALALTRLGATPRWLDFPEVEYRDEVDETALAAGIGSALRECRPRRLAVPLGLRHPDHVLAHRAGRAAALATSADDVIFYADFYHLDDGGLLRSRLEELSGVGLDPLPTRSVRGGRRRKRRAIRAYRSQRRGLGRDLHRRATASPELYWRATALTTDP